MTAEPETWDEPTELDAVTWARLQAPFEPNDLRTFTGRGNNRFTYADARAVQGRLDEVVGSRNWSTAYRVLYVGEPETHKADNGREYITQRVAVECTLTIFGVVRSDCGQAYAEDETFKSAYTDAFRRAAAQFGVARYLYEHEQKRPVPNGRQNGDSSRQDGRGAVSGATIEGRGRSAGRGEPAAPTREGPVPEPGAPIPAPGGDVPREGLLSDYPDPFPDTGAEFVRAALARFGLTAPHLDAILVQAMPEDRRPANGRLNWAASPMLGFPGVWKVLRRHEEAKMLERAATGAHEHERK